MVVRESQLIASPWQIDFFVKEEIALDLLKGSGEIDFEIDSGTSSDRLRLGGEGWLESVGVENTVSTWEENNGPLFQIHLEGDRKLVRL